jgi:HD-GYP domain-containing protein (c-di-GMP phosphodiesterase class II)
MSEAAWIALDPVAEVLLEQSRARRRQRLHGRERLVKWASVCAFGAAVAALGAAAPPAALPSMLLLAALVGAYAIAAQVEFEVGNGSAVPTQIVLVPMLFALPPALVPLAVAAGFLLGETPALLRGDFHRERLAAVVLSAWHSVGAAAVFALAGSPEPSMGALPVLAVALAAQFALEFVTTGVREVLAVGAPLATLVRAYKWVFAVDAMLTPLGFLAAIGSVAWAGGFLFAVPLLLLIRVFALERSARIDSALELSHAYRGTDFLLGDVVEADDAYTGSHSREVVDLVVAVSGRLGLDPPASRRAEFAALLHDIGKIRIPKTLINKPGPLDAEEWELMKTHTIAGEEMLEQIGGLLGEVGTIVRSCHEQWDGGGYPDGLAGEAIPVEARIISACDALNAMTTERPYRAARSIEEALAELRSCAGTQFDARVVEALALGFEEGVLTAK